MENLLKPRKYCAIHTGDAIIIRGTRNGLRKITSTLTNKEKGITLTQVVYKGGIIIGSMKYSQWTALVKKVIPADGYLAIDKDLVRAVAPYLN